MSRRTPAFSNLNIRSEQPIKRFKISGASFDSSSYRNVFEQFNDVLPPPPPPPPLPSITVNTQKLVPKPFTSKISSQQSSLTSSSMARSIMAKKVVKQDDELWSVLFQPKHRHDLILHPKKVKDLEQIIEKSCELTTRNKIQGSTKLILISGPSGCGKSTCLRLVAASLNINIVEWETRTTTALTSSVLDEQRDDHQWTESQKRSFRNFVFQSTRYLSSSTGNPSNGIIFEDENEQSSIKSQSSSSSSSSTKQIVLIEVSLYIY